MTNITVYKKHGTYNAIQISGHAGYADAGCDVVCAGISVLSINFINSVEHFTNDEFILDSDSDTGLIDFKFKGIPSKDSQLLINSLVLGLTDIKEENKDFITLDYKEV